MVWPRTSLRLPPCPHPVHPSVARLGSAVVRTHVSLPHVIRLSRRLRIMMACLSFLVVACGSAGPHAPSAPSEGDVCSDLDVLLNDLQGKSSSEIESNQETITHEVDSLVAS